MKIKVSEATGPVLDWMVAKCLGVNFVHGDYEYSTTTNKVWARGGPQECRYSTDWSQGGPIIEGKHIDLYYSTSNKHWAAAIWHDIPGGGQLDHKVYGPTPLIAAMRCFVASKLSDEVKVPEELT